MCNFSEGMDISYSTATPSYTDAEEQSTEMDMFITVPSQEPLPVYQSPVEPIPGYNSFQSKSSHVCDVDVKDLADPGVQGGLKTCLDTATTTIVYSKPQKPLSRVVSATVLALVAVSAVAMCIAHLSMQLGLTIPSIPWLHSAHSSPVIQALPDRVFSHLANLESIADQHGGSRSVATGHPASVDYVLSHLYAMNSTFNVWTEDVLIKTQVDRRPPAVSIFDYTQSTLLSNLSPGISLLRHRGKHGKETVFKPHSDVAVVPGSGSATVLDGILRVVDSCDVFDDQSEDMATKHKKKSQDWVAVIGPYKSTSCSPCGRLAAAVRLGAKAAIVYSTPGGQKGYARSLAPTPLSCVRYGIAEELLSKIAIVSLSDSAAFTLLERMSAFASSTFVFGGKHDLSKKRKVVTDLRVDIDVQSSYTEIVSKNVLAETHAGNDERIVIFGSHLDSVPAGPGINDDGSGAMATLELATAFHESALAASTVQKLRFAWWTGEEIGLLGSTAYVKKMADTNKTLLSHHKANIDSDMIASPNFVRGIWDGGAIVDSVVRRRCKTLHDLFATWFGTKGLPTVPFPFNGRSDFEPFLQAGIPAGGVITGEDEIKTIEGAALFGGLPGIVLDPCYHQDCDRLAGLVNEDIMIQNLEALAHVLEVLSTTADIESFLDAGVPTTSNYNPIHAK
ncbi:hypothetical protein O5D80_002171 [Batrachochytrium dendrobatidis]|nr:hypothetical protein O5D80_002171 [Batrachochytrium dendrobatidis]